MVTFARMQILYACECVFFVVGVEDGTGGLRRKQIKQLQSQFKNPRECSLKEDTAGAF